MKALSFMQPYAWLTAAGIKPVDNRLRKWDYRGPILIHASQQHDQHALTRIGDRVGQWAVDRVIEAAPLVYGALIGKAVIVEWVTEYQSPWFWGPYGAVIEQAELFANPIPYPGQLGLFDVPENVVEAGLFDLTN
jgi:hypothetical protein